MDLPLVAVVASVWTYWTIVGAMSLRVRRRTRKLAGVVPEQGLERAMWLVWVPLVALWMALPAIALGSGRPGFALPEFARVPPYLRRARHRGGRRGRSRSSPRSSAGSAWARAGAWR